MKKLKDFCSEHPHTYHLDSTINILLCLPYYVSFSLQLSVHLIFDAILLHQSKFQTNAHKLQSTLGRVGLNCMSPL